MASLFCSLKDAEDTAAVAAVAGTHRCCWSILLWTESASALAMIAISSGDSESLDSSKSSDPCGDASDKCGVQSLHLHLEKV
jgi:hypothetical protein